MVDIWEQIVSWLPMMKRQKDEMRQSVLRLSKPQRTKLVIKSIEDSIRAIKYSGV